MEPLEDELPPGEESDLPPPPPSSPRRGKRTLQLPIPAWAVPLLEKARYKGVHGGRGGGKSHGVLELQILAQIQNPDRNMVCIREVQKSLKDSVKRLLEQKIRKMKVDDYFEIKSTEIRSAKGTGIIIFQGMTEHTAHSIKSLEGIDCAVIEEAQTLSKRSLDLLRPTIRQPDSELWFIWNPQHDTDPVDVLLRGPNRPPNSIVVEVNYDENPHLTEVLRAEAEYDRVTDPDKYAHVWKGEYEKHSEARIFKTWRVEEFETPHDAILRFGVDWGFSPDPIVMIRCFVEGRKLFIDYEAWEVNCEIEDTRALFMSVPGSEKWTITAGSDRPERIKSAQRQGFKIRGAVRGNHSVIEGIEWLQNYEIIIHPRCVHAVDEFKNFKRPIDKLTGLVLPMLPTKKNHIVEAARYAVEDVRRFAQGKPPGAAPFVPRPILQLWGGGRR